MRRKCTKLFFKIITKKRKEKNHEERNLENHPASRRISDHCRSCHPRHHQLHGSLAAALPSLSGMRPLSMGGFAIPPHTNSYSRQETKQTLVGSFLGEDIGGGLQIREEQTLDFSNIISLV